MAISSTTPKASKKFNQKYDYQQRKKNDFQKKQKRGPMSDKKKLWKQKDKERTNQLCGNRKWKEQETTLYSRVTIRKGKQLYDDFDTKYDNDLQFMGTEEYHDLRRKEKLMEMKDYWRYIDYYDEYDYELNDTYRMETIRQQEEQEQRWDEEKRQRKKQKKLKQRLELEKLEKNKEKQTQKNERCTGRCTTCGRSCSSSNSSDTRTQTQSLSFDYDYDYY